MDCSECEESFKDELSLEKHLYKKHKIGDGKFHKCELCEYKTGIISHLKTHEARAHDIDVNWNKCEKCDSKFKTKGELKRHKVYIHNIDVIWYKCTECDSKFKSNSNLKKHKASIHNIDAKWYKCEKCDSKFKTKGELKIHKARIHDIDVKWYKCEKCDSKFKTNSELKRHNSYIHNINVKWYKCEKCDSKFKSNNELKSHKAHVHNIDVIWYKCDKCDSKFKTNSNLKAHNARIHNIDVIWYKCTECEYKSKAKGHLKRHQENVHDQGDKTCELLQCKCFKLYSYRYKDKAIKVCRKCYKKCTGFKCRPEEQMVKHLQNIPSISPYIVLKDRIIAHDSCDTKRRPDILISSGDIHIIVECDEKQHRSYLPSCESGRMDEIIDELKTGQIVFIRWNPDYYKAKKKDNRKQRLTKLSDLILQITSGKKELPHISVLYMYYDKDNEVICDRWYKEFI
mgnify:CR=1 FL=1